MDDNIVVSIVCTVYNQESFLEKCLDGFIKQKTSFQYEILVHDDASSDGSPKIIEYYYKKYPKLIVPILQKENQFSRGVHIIDEVLTPIARGKYIAVCEGDDYWIDSEKLQKQYEYMEHNPRCVLCTHNTKIYNLLNKSFDGYFNRWTKVHRLTEKDIFMGWDVHASSYFFRKELVKETRKVPYVWCGDYKRLVVANGVGEVVSLPEVMSVYNFNNSDGETWKYNTLLEKVNRLKERIRFLEAYNMYTAFRHRRVIKKRIKLETLNIKYTLFRMKMVEDGRVSYDRKNTSSRPNRSFILMLMIASPLKADFLFNCIRTALEIRYPKSKE